VPDPASCPPAADVRYSAIALAIATVMYLPWLLLYAIAGKEVLSAKVYHALDAAALDLSAYGECAGPPLSMHP
jgi:hypothetical protein